MERKELNDLLMIKLGDEQAAEIMEWVDDYVASLTRQERVEGWTAEEVAEYIGAKNANAARSTLSRWGIKALDKGMANPRDEFVGWQKALYPTHRVIEEHGKRRSR